MFKRINFSIDEELAAKVDNEAERYHMTRSAALALMITRYFETQEMMDNFKILAQAYQSEQIERIGGGDQTAPKG